MQAIVVGAGVVGSCISYFLCQKSQIARVILLEQSSDAALGASGKAGGFLAKPGWNTTAEVAIKENILSRGFDLHKMLAETVLGGESIDYRRMMAIAVEADASKKSLHQSDEPELEWLDGCIESISVLNPESLGRVAQVHPRKFTHGMIAAAERSGKFELRLNSKVQGLIFDGKKCTGVEMKEGIETADKVVLSMGPWSHNIRRWLMEIGVNQSWDVTSEKYHSIVLKSQHEIPPVAVFLEYKYRNDVGKISNESPEIYPRPNGELYICGKESKEELPEDPSEVYPIKSACIGLQTIGESVSNKLVGSTVHVEQACYLPYSMRPAGRKNPAKISSDPLVGEITENLFIATGSNCWGILTGPALGEIVAELLVVGKFERYNIEDLALPN